MLLETPRLLLIPPSHDHFEEICRLFAAPLVMRYIGNGKTRDREEAQKAIETNEKHWEAFGYGFWTIIEKETKAFVGRGGLIHIAFNHEEPDVELGYILTKEHWGKGYATEVARHFIQWGFAHLDNPYFMAMTYKENTASQNVLKKVGFTFDREDIYPNTDFKSLFFKITR